jgi:hypothetical protein
VISGRMRGLSCDHIFLLYPSPCLRELSIKRMHFWVAGTWQRGGRMVADVVLRVSVGWKLAGSINECGMELEWRSMHLS